MRTELKRLRCSRWVLGCSLAAALLSGCGASTGVPAHAPMSATSHRPTGLTYRLLYSFGGSSTDGVDPVADLADVGGVLYGTTLGGGSGCYASGGCGTVFSVTTSGTESVLHSFTGGTDGALPYGDLADVDGVLYGTTGGGASTLGTVFSITTAGAESPIYHFKGTPDGSDPHSGLLDYDGALYGATVFGGKRHFGTVFEITTSGTESVFYSFLGPHVDGKYPDASPVNVDGIFYGATYKGGPLDRGMVYKITPSGGETVLHNFSGVPKDGGYPRSGLVSYRGMFYGTTSGGGSPGCKECGMNPGNGTVFEITPSGRERVLYEFKGYPTDGAVPYGNLRFHNGNFFGTTQYGGANCAVSHGCGTIFSITPNGTERVLYSFLPKQGSFPVAGLVYLKGAFYGTTPSGGAYNHGTIFSLTVPDDANR
jgi:uncharacterized repeat protein (TIGR03803 family)